MGRMSKPLAIDLFAGLGGWTEGLLVEGWAVVGFDIERHQYGDQQYPAQLVLQDVLMIHGKQFKDASLIVASPPCQKYSWLAMPWSRSTSNNSQAAKALRRKWETEGPDNRLFDACFRIQREASEAAGRHIPMVVENVRGAQEWVGRPAAWNYGSFYLWGDVPALMPLALNGRMKYPSSASERLWKDREVPRLNDGESSMKNKTGGSWFGIPASPGTASRQDPRDVRRNANGDFVSIMNNPVSIPGGNGIKGSADQLGGDHQTWFDGGLTKHGSRSNARKAASAQIAKIPLPLSRHIARCYYPLPLRSGPVPDTAK